MENISYACVMSGPNLRDIRYCDHGNVHVNTTRKSCKVVAILRLTKLYMMAKQRQLTSP